MHPEPDPADDIARQVNADAGLAAAIAEAGPYADPSTPMPTDPYQVGLWVGASTPHTALEPLLQVTEEELVSPTSTTEPEQHRVLLGLRDNLKIRIAYRQQVHGDD